MTLQTNMSVEQLCSKIGNHVRRKVQILFPEDLGISKMGDTLSRLLDGNIRYFTNENSSYCIATLEEFRTKLNLFSGFDWPLILQEEVHKQYGFLEYEKTKETLYRWPDPRGMGELDPKVRPVFQDTFYYNVIDPIGEALLNAFKWGNDLDIRKKLTLDFYLGEEGMGFSVSDDGDGFDVEDKIRKYNEGNERRGQTFIIAIDRAPRIGLQVAYNHCGNQWMARYDFEKGLYKPANQK